MGRERFRDLLNKLRRTQQNRRRTALWVYGTRGYGKSHLLAALVCYLAVRGERVVYIPDCRECLKSPVEYIQAAMLFAWADDDDDNIQREIISLDTQEKIRHFFRSNQKILFVIDQMNGLAEMDGDDNQTRDRKGKVREWLDGCRASHKAILSASANYKAYLQSSEMQNTEVTMRVYGGLTEVSLGKNNCFVNGIVLLTMI